jgi:hypothetical protein
MATNHVEPDGTGKHSDTAVDLIPESLSETLTMLPDTLLYSTAEGGDDIKQTTSS